MISKHRLIMDYIVYLLSYTAMNSRWSKELDLKKNKTSSLKNYDCDHGDWSKDDKWLMVKLIMENFVQHKAKSKTMDCYSWWIWPTLIWQTNIV